MPKATTIGPIIGPMVTIDPMVIGSSRHQFRVRLLIPTVPVPLARVARQHATEQRSKGFDFLHSNNDLIPSSRGTKPQSNTWSGLGAGRQPAFHQVLASDKLFAAAPRDRGLAKEP